MLTPQEVSNRSFTKSAFGGYNMAMVDEFLDELTDDYTSLYKENAALKAKMKVLVDKVEEYRSTEDSMRAALLTAQKMASTMVEEAAAKREQMLLSAESEVRSKTAGLQDELLFEQKRLNAAREKTASFVAEVKKVCEAQLALLEKLPDLTPETIAAPEAFDAFHSEVDNIEKQILSSFKTDDEVRQEKENEEMQNEQQDLFSDGGNPFPDKETRAVKLEELKFGRNYRAEE